MVFKTYLSTLYSSRQLVHKLIISYTVPVISDCTDPLHTMVIIIEITQMSTTYKLPVHGGSTRTSGNKQYIIKCSCNSTVHLTLNDAFMSFARIISPSCFQQALQTSIKLFLQVRALRMNFHIQFKQCVYSFGVT